MLLVLGCSAPQSQNVSIVYTSEEIAFYKQYQSHLRQFMSHIQMFDSLSKNAKPPYDDAELFKNLLVELQKATNEAIAIAALDCPSIKFQELCTHFKGLEELMLKFTRDMSRYYDTDLSESECHNIMDDQKKLSTIANNLASEAAQIENQFGKMR